MTVSSRIRASISTLALATVLTGCATPGAQAPVDINFVAINDFHGNLEATRYSYTDPATGKKETVRAGGIDTLAAALQAWRKEDKDLLFVSVGDSLGGSPALSSLWADEPAIEALNMLGLRASAVGNHEFDPGRKEFLRQLNGGCDSPRPTKACKLAPGFKGASFTYLGANVIDSATGKPFVPAFRIEEVKGVKVGLVGVVLKNIASVTMGSSIAGLTFGDEAEAINKAIPAMRAQGAKVFVALVHEGGMTPEAYDQAGCSQLKGPVVDIVKRLDPSVRLVLTGHTHQGYLCNVDGRVVTQGGAAGHMLTRVTMKVDPVSGSVADINARNVLMKPGVYPAEPKVGAYLAMVKERSREALTRPVARLGVTSVSRAQSEAGESALGNLIADAVLAATREQGAQIAFMNSGGIRKDLESGNDQVTTFGQAQAVLPFGNTLVLMDLTGAQLRALLEQQWKGGSVLQISHGLTYRWDEKRPPGQRVLPDSLKLHGAPIEDGKTYRIVVNNFLAEGGDKFPEFAKGTNRVETGMLDLDALIDYLRKSEGAGATGASLAPSARIEKVR